uniref:MATH domain-containing protein n=1 Tax=Heterorhabditis bacteriophora TaxID=37862 RepID=A0A1I7X6X4_HETBA
MDLSEIRHLKPVSKDMKYLVENGGHRRSVDCLFIGGRPSGGYCWSINLHYRSEITFPIFSGFSKGVLLIIFGLQMTSIDCDFCDDDLFAENYSGTELGKCSVSKRTLRGILEQETLECRCRIEYCDFELQNDIDVDHLTRALPNPVNTAGSEWKMRSRTGRLRRLFISPNKTTLPPLF